MCATATLKCSFSIASDTLASAPWAAFRSASAGSPKVAGRSAGVVFGTLGCRAALPPQPVGEPPGALDAALGPFDVALGRRVRKHEPARHVGAVGRHDVV